MKIFLVAFVILCNSFASATTFKCKATDKDLKEPFLPKNYITLNLENDQARFQRYEVFSMGEKLVEDYVFSFNRVVTEQTRVKSMLEFTITQHIKRPYGLKLPAIYLSSEMLEGKNGTLIGDMVKGWDWNYCIAQ
jgi:hypothetical protein